MTITTGGSTTMGQIDATEERDRSPALDSRSDHRSAFDLPDRAAAIDRLAAVLDDVPPDTTTAIAVVDIDRLADVNDTLGHDLGDRLLESTARRLAGAIRAGDVIARTGDDEFVVVCTGLADDGAATELGDRIRRSLTGRLAVDDLELDVSVSVGVTVVDPQALDQHRPIRRRAQELLSQAHAAMRTAKQRGRGRSVRFGEELAGRTHMRCDLAAALSKALRERQLEVVYQPIFSAVDEHAEGIAALLRWNHPTRGLLEAGDFVSVAEQTGAIVPIGDWVLDQACASLRRMIDERLVSEGCAIHVDTSRLQLGNPGFVTRSVEVLNGHGLEPRQLVVGVLDPCPVDHDAAEVVRSVRALRRFGIRTAIDSFGTRSDALCLLTEIGADVLKLDGGLALPVGSPETDTGVVRALVLLARALGMQVVAERVTGIEQLRRLRAAGCDLVQGDLLGPPSRLRDLGAQMER